MAARDRWIGWVASAVLARSVGQMAADWLRHCNVKPWLVETLVSVTG